MHLIRSRSIFSSSFTVMLPYILSSMLIPCIRIDVVRFALSSSLSSFLFKNCTIFWIFALHCKKYGCLSFTCTEFLDLWLLLSLVLAVAKLSNRNLHRMRFCGNICDPINLFIFDNAFCILALEFMAHLNILPRKIPFK